MNTSPAKNKSRRPRTTVAAAIKKASVGRPSKYKPEFCGAMDRFFDVEPIIRIVLKDGRVQHAFNSFPTFEGFALSVGVVSDTLRRWASETDASGEPLKPEFTAAYARAKDRQIDMMTAGALSGGYSPSAAALGLKNVVGWKDKVEVDSTQNLKGPTAEELDAIYAEGTRKSAELNATRPKLAKSP